MCVDNSQFRKPVNGRSIKCFAVVNNWKFDACGEEHSDIVQIFLKFRMSGSNHISIFP